MGDGPALRYAWDKIEWVAFGETKWTSKDVLDLVLRVEELGSKKETPRPRLYLVKDNG